MFRQKRNRHHNFTVNSLIQLETKCRSRRMFEGARETEISKNSSHCVTNLERVYWESEAMVEVHCCWMMMIHSMTTPPDYF